MSRPPATQYSIHLRVSLSNVPGVLGNLATQIGAVGRQHLRGRCVRREGHAGRAGHRRQLPQRRAPGRGGRRGQEHARDHTPRLVGPDLQDARRRQDRGAAAVPGRRSGRPVDGVHPGRRQGLHGDRGERGAGRHLHDPEEHGRDRVRRHGGARPRRHRAEGCDARHGGQGAALQGVRRGRRLPDLPRRVDARGDHRDGGAAGADVRRHQPRRHRRARCVPGGGSAEGAARHPDLPRRPARHGRCHVGRARERAADHGQADERPVDRHLGCRRGRGRDRQDPPRRRGDEHRRGRLAWRGLRRSRRAEPLEAVVRREHQPRTASRGRCPTSCTAPTCSSGSARPTS